MIEYFLTIIFMTLVSLVTYSYMWRLYGDLSTILLFLFMIINLILGFCISKLLNILKEKNEVEKK